MVSPLDGANIASQAVALFFAEDPNSANPDAIFRVIEVVLGAAETVAASSTSKPAGRLTHQCK